MTSSSSALSGEPPLLFVLEGPLPITPIALELHAHFTRGGSKADAVRLVEAIERAASRQPARKREMQSGKGSRLPPDWEPASSEIAYAISAGLSERRISFEVEKFRNYWISRTGAGATKRDWSATWRNWVLNALERQHGFRDPHSGAAGASRRPASGSDAVLAGMGKLTARLDQNSRPEIGEARTIREYSDPSPQFALEPPRTR